MPPRAFIIVLSLASWAGGCAAPSVPLDAGPRTDAATEDDARTMRVDADATDAGVEPTSDAGATEGWRREADLPFPFQELAYAMHGGSLVIAGGLDESAAVHADVLALDPGASSFRALPSLPGPRHHVMLASVGTDLFAIGGMDSLAFDPRDDAYVLHDGATAWEPIATLPEPRAAAFAGVVDGRVYVVAGQTTRGLASTVLVYDPALDDWETGPALPRPREHVAGFVDDGEIWLVGGRDFTLATAGSLVDVFDPASGMFRESASLVGRHAGHGAAIAGTLALVVGGELPTEVVDTIEARGLDGSWTVLTHVPTPRHGLAVGVIGGRLYVVGGADRPTFGASAVVESFALP